MATQTIEQARYQNTAGAARWATVTGATPDSRQGSAPMWEGAPHPYRLAMYPDGGSR
jgi:hypothetical protein